MTTDKLALLEIDLSVPGWDVIFNADIQKLDDAYSDIEILEYGETIAEFEAVYIKSDSLAWLAQANGTDQPGFGLAVDSGVATDEKRIKNRGVVTNVAWAWTNFGKFIYLDPTTPGALTETQPANNSQIMGVIFTATTIFINPVSEYQKPAIDTATYAANQTLTVLEANGYVIYVTGAAIITLPAIAVGMSVTIITIGAIAVSIDPNASDKILLDGVALDDGDKITNLSTTGDIAVLTYYSADGWYAVTNSWTDGGA